MEILKGAAYTLNAILAIILTLSLISPNASMKDRAVCGFVIGLLVFNTILIMIGA